MNGEPRPTDAEGADAVRYEDIVEAQRTIADTVRPTPLIRSYGLEERLGREVWLKAESLQRTGSFKPRGALNWVRHAPRRLLERGLVTVSAGNHAQALAWAARAAGAAVTVVMPADASPMKVRATRRYGAEVVLHGRINEAIAKMEELRDGRGLVLVHPFDDPWIIAGQGTVGLEIISASGEHPPDVILCPIGGGGLISGIAIAAKAKRKGIRVIGVEPEGAATLRYAWDRGGPQRLPRVGSVAPSLGAAVAGRHTYELSRRYVDDIVTVSDEQIIDGLRALMTEGKLYAEPGGAVGVAALLAGKTPLGASDRVAVVISGGNLDPAKARELI